MELITIMIYYIQLWKTVYKNVVFKIFLFLLNIIYSNNSLGTEEFDWCRSISHRAYSNTN